MAHNTLDSLWLLKLLALFRLQWIFSFIFGLRGHIMSETLLHFSIVSWLCSPIQI